MTKILLLPATHGLPALYCQQSPNFYARRPAVQLIVIHDVEGSYESGIVTFMTDRRIIGSQRILFGSDADGRLGHKAGHVEGFNDRSIDVELAGVHGERVRMNCGRWRVRRPICFIASICPRARRSTAVLPPL